MPDKPLIAGAVPIPNALFDEVLPTLTDTELRVLLIVLRQTLGWREGSDFGGWRYKQRDWLSHAQLQSKTGRASEAVSRAVASLVDNGLMVAEDADGCRLDTPQKRRRHLGRVYYRPGEMWKTATQAHTARPKTTTDNRNNKRIHSQRADGWEQAASAGRYGR